MRSPVARVSSSASACSRASGVGPCAERSSSASAQAPVGVGREVARKWVRQWGNVAGEDQGAGGAAGHPHCRMSVRNWRTVRICPRWCPDRHRGAVVVSGGAQCGQPRLDVGAPLQRRQVGDRRVQAGQEAAESGEVAGDRLDGGRCPGGGGLLAVVEEQGAQRFVHAAVVPGQPGPAARILRRGVQDAEVEQHPVRGKDQRAVVDPAAAVAFRLGAAVQRGGQLVHVRGDQLVEPSAGLDQQPQHHPFGDAFDDALAVVEIGCRGGEPSNVSGEHAAACLREQATDLAVRQVVVARPQPPGEHQERDERPLRGTQPQPAGQRFGRERGRVGPVPQKRPRRVDVAGRAPPVGGQPTLVVGDQVGGAGHVCGAAVRSGHAAPPGPGRRRPAPASARGGCSPPRSPRGRARAGSG